MSRHESVDICDEIRRERDRQLFEEGFTAAHDDEHRGGDLAKVAAILAADGTRAVVRDLDGFSSDGDPWRLIEKHGSDRRRCLVIAASLLVAEIERLDRATVAKRA